METQTKDMREIIKDIISFDRVFVGHENNFSEDHIDNVLFSLGMKVNQKIILK